MNHKAHLSDEEYLKACDRVLSAAREEATRKRLTTLPPMKNTPTLMHTPHAAAILAGVATSPRRYNRLTRLTADCGSILVLTEHDAYCASHEFDLIASSGLTLADLREIHAYIVAEVVIPTRNA